VDRWNSYPLDISAPVSQEQIDQLERLSDEEFWDYARRLVHTVPPAVHPNEYLECTLRQGRCLIPLTALYEVVLPPHTLALLPALPLWMLGVVAWRGEAIACIDLEAYLSNVPATFSPQQGILREGLLLMVRHADIPVGLLVPAIGQTTPLLSEQETPTIVLPTWCAPARGACVQRIQGEALVLDIPTLLSDVVQQLEIAAAYG
jgi:chemotaxis signal transduction protein